jgi:hypothetical protein
MIWIPIAITVAAVIVAWVFTPEQTGDNSFGWVFGCMGWMAAAVVVLIAWLIWSLAVAK